MPGRDGTGPIGMGWGCCGAGGRRGFGQRFGQRSEGGRRGFAGAAGLRPQGENTDIANLRQEAETLKTILAKIENRLSAIENKNNG